jgi:hypothetical protein
MSTPMQRFPLTAEQRTQLDQDLRHIEERLQDISVLMRACYGEESQAAIRAGETSNALQRFKWALEQAQENKGSRIV